MIEEVQLSELVDDEVKARASRRDGSVEGLDAVDLRKEAVRLGYLVGDLRTWKEGGKAKQSMTQRGKCTMVSFLKPFFRYRGFDPNSDALSHDRSWHALTPLQLESHVCAHSVVVAQRA